MGQTLRVWTFSLDGFGHFRVECVHPLSAAELTDVLDYLEIIKKQLRRFVEAPVTAAEAKEPAK